MDENEGKGGRDFQTGVVPQVYWLPVYPLSLTNAHYNTCASLSQKCLQYYYWRSNQLLGNMDLSLLTGALF